MKTYEELKREIDGYFYERLSVIQKKIRDSECEFHSEFYRGQRIALSVSRHEVKKLIEQIEKE